VTIAGAKTLFKPFIFFLIQKDLQGGYHMCSETMLCNMASMEEKREKLQALFY
jgi:hypothetical protein